MSLGEAVRCIGRSALTFACEFRFIAYASTQEPETRSVRASGGFGNAREPLHAECGCCCADWFWVPALCCPSATVADRIH